MICVLALYYRVLQSQSHEPEPGTISHGRPPCTASIDSCNNADADLELPLVDTTYHPAADEKWAPTVLARSKAGFLLRGQEGAAGTEVRVWAGPSRAACAAASRKMGGWAGAWVGPPEGIPLLLFACSSPPPWWPTRALPFLAFKCFTSA